MQFITLIKSNIYILKTDFFYIVSKIFLSCPNIFIYHRCLLSHNQHNIIPQPLEHIINVFWFQFRKVSLIYFCLLCSLKFSIGSVQIISTDKPVNNFNIYIMKSLLKFQFRKPKFVSKLLSFLKTSHVILMRTFDKKEKNPLLVFWLHYWYILLSGFLFNNLYLHYHTSSIRFSEYPTLKIIVVLIIHLHISYDPILRW